MKGKEAIIDSIINDAKAEAERIKAQATEQADKITSAAAAEAKEAAARVVKEAVGKAKEASSRAVASAEMEVGKYALGLKQDIISRCFGAALDKLGALDDKKYLSLMGALLACAEDGDEVIVSKADKNRVTEAFVANAAKGKKVTLSAGGDFVGGVILSSDKYDKNLTFEALLDEMKEEILPDVAEILFGEK